LVSRDDPNCFQQFLRPLSTTSSIALPHYILCNNEPSPITELSNMVFTPARVALSRVASGVLRSPVAYAPRTATLRVALQHQQLGRRGYATETKEYSVRDALNEALGKFLVFSIWGRHWLTANAYQS